MNRITVGSFNRYRGRLRFERNDYSRINARAWIFITNKIDRTEMIYLQVKWENVMESAKFIFFKRPPEF